MKQVRPTNFLLINTQQKFDTLMVVMMTMFSAL
jgi:hypothetical protein